MRRKQQGSALIILIAVFVVVLLLGVGTISMRIVSSLTKPEINNSGKAFYLAESGKRFANFPGADGSGTDGKIYRLSLSDDEQFRLLIASDTSITSTGIIYQNSMLETIRQIGGLRKFGQPCWYFDNPLQPGEDSCGINQGILNGLSLEIGKSGFDTALYCNGTGWMDTPFKPLVEIGSRKPFSISFWAKPDTLGKEQIVLGVSDGSYRFSVGISSSDEWFWAYGNKWSYVVNKLNLQKIKVVMNQWQKITLIYTGVSGTNQITMYVSGCDQQESLPYTYDGNFSMQASNLFVCAEHTPLPLQVSLPFSGLVDDIKIYDRAVEPVEFIPTCGLRCDPNAVAYYSFNGDAKDSTANNNHGTVSITGATLTTDRFGCPDKAYRFDGSAGYIRVADHNSLDLNSEGTLAAWIYTDTFKNNAGIIHKGIKTNFSDEVYSLQFLNDSKLRLFFNGAPPEVVISSADFKTPAAGYIQRWHHVAVTWKPSSPKFEVVLYVDGKIDKSSLASASAPNNSTGDLMIGAQLPGNYYFNGKIDDMVIYNRALSADEIAMLVHSDN